MKNPLFHLVLIVLLNLGCQNSPLTKKAADVEKNTTYYFIRHAEKDLSDSGNNDPELTDKGRERAQAWATHFKDIKLDAVYSTDYKRTRATAGPTASSKGLKVQSYDGNELYSEAFAKATKGMTVLVVGHSNTSPAFVNKIVGREKYGDMKEDNFSNLYTVTIKNDTPMAKLKRVLINPN